MVIAASALRRRDLFATSNGTVYETLRGSVDGGPVQARLWCAHLPDRLASAPRRTDFPAANQVHVLRWEDVEEHTRHVGYVRATLHCRLIQSAMAGSIGSRGDTMTIPMTHGHLHARLDDARRHDRPCWMAPGSKART